MSTLKKSEKSTFEYIPLIQFIYQKGNVAYEINWGIICLTHQK